MRQRNRTYSALAGIVVGLSFYSIGQAQSSTTFTQNEFSENPISLSQTPTRPSSWQGQAVALEGQDVVSFFKSDAPSVGSEKYSAKWDDTTWHFSSEENLDLFAKNPYKYVPEFGGYCPVSLAHNEAKIGLTKHYTVEDEKLYLNYNQTAQDEFRRRPKEYIVQGQLKF